MKPMTPPMEGGRKKALYQHLVLALVAYVPLLLTARDRVAADTKTYLYLDPGRLLSRALSMWDPHVGLGTVTHQTIGYLWPMGPWFWTFDTLGAPDWVAQRLWVGTLLFTAGAGILYLLRTLDVSRRNAIGAFAAALVYALSPYVLHYAARISVLLLPWAALPWLVGLVERSLRTRSWRHPAAFALLVATAGGVNATALVLAGLGPLLWIPFAVWVHRDVEWKPALVATFKLGGLTLLCSLWWIAGLWAQGKYGIGILRYTETVETVARTSLSSEVLRGLGYWFFYGGDKLGSWIEPGRSYTQHLWLIGVGFVIPAVSLLVAFGVRWRYRAFAVAMVLLGTAISVGAYPYPAPSPIGALFKAFARTSTAGMALRSTPRAIPLVALGMALLVAAGLAALSTRKPRAALGSAVAVALVAAIGIPPLWTGDFIGENLQRPEDVPKYWYDAAAYLDKQGDATRVFEVPGADFASYRWGNTVDPILPGMMDRPYAARELIPYGSEASADLLNAFDRRMQEGVLDASAIAPVARLMGVGDVVVRSDLQYERYRTPRPLTLWNLLTDPVPAGLDQPKGFGKAVPNVAISKLPLRDEIFLGTPASTPDPSPVSAFAVQDPLPIVRTRDAEGAILMAGDGEGVVEAAAAGLLGGSQPLLYSAALADKPKARATVLADDASFLLTDSNRKRARRWSTVRENTGYTEQAGEEPLVEDPSDNRLPLFPDAGDDAYTTVEQRGVESVQASDYGNPVSYTAEDRPANAFDGDTATAWRTGAFDGVKGERIVLKTQSPVTVDHVNVVQPLTGPRNRYITKLKVAVDGQTVGTFRLDGSSRSEAGQDLSLGKDRTFSELTLTIAGDNVGKRALYDGFSGVGLSEVRVDGVHLDEVVELPTDLLADTGRGEPRHPLTILLSRLRSNPQELVRSDEERSMNRSFTLPSARQFTLGGEARLSAGVPDEVIDRLLGSTGPEARSSRHLAGDLSARASSALDGDDATAWTSGFGQQVGDWIDVDVPAAPIDHLDLTVLADGYHSVPTRLVVTTDRGDHRVVDVPTVADGAKRGATAGVTVRFPAVQGATMRVTVDAVRPTMTTDWFSAKKLAMPVAIAELGIPGVRLGGTGTVSSACRTDLLTVDGEPVGVTITGDRAAAVGRQGLTVASCGPTVDLGPGEHLLRTALGIESGIDLDRLVLSSEPASGLVLPKAGEAKVQVVKSSDTSFDLKVTGATADTWLVLGQSWSDGWHADVSGAGDIGPGAVVDGYANGWRLPGTEDGTYTVHLRWKPQRTVKVALWASLLAALACLVIVLLEMKKRYVPMFSSEPPDPATAIVRVEPVAPEPELRRPLWRTGPPVPVLHAAVASVFLGLVAALVVHPLFALWVAFATAAALRLPKSRILGLAAPTLVVLAGSFTIAKQWRNGFPPDFGWADFFKPAHYLAWGGLWVVVVLLLTDFLRRTVQEPWPVEASEDDEDGTVPPPDGEEDGERDWSEDTAKIAAYRARRKKEPMPPVRVEPLEPEPTDPEG
jgi:arabinofuranan 3-O-arabinosyltransferase